MDLFSDVFWGKYGMDLSSDVLGAKYGMDLFSDVFGANMVWTCLVMCLGKIIWYGLL